MNDDHTAVLRALMNVVTDLDELPHPRAAGRILLGAAVAGKGCSDDAVARTASMAIEAVRYVIPTMLDRRLHVPPLLVAEATWASSGVMIYTGIRLTEEAERRLMHLREYIART